MLLGQTAIANAKAAYRSFQRIFEGERFDDLRAAGAQVQRPLWASTGTKNPAYSDTLYVDNLIGPHTVNTLPPATLAAFKDHGLAAETITQSGGQFLPPDEVLDRLAEVGIDLGQVTSRLQDDGVDAFIEAFETLISQVAAKRTLLRSGIMERTKLALGIYHAAVDRAIERLAADFANPRLWNKDGSLWKNHGPTMEKIVNRLGWLDFEKTIDRERLAALQESVRGARFRHVVLLGMGGSSLAPEVLADTFGPQAGFPQLIVLDSTDPARIRQVEDGHRHRKIRSSSSPANRAAPSKLWRSTFTFWEKTGGNAEQFIIITDPGSRLERVARKEGVRDYFLNPLDIGGRYSALSYFGMVPAALIGLDLDSLWSSADTMLATNRESIPSTYHPGLLLGAVIGALAREGRIFETYGLDRCMWGTDWTRATNLLTFEQGVEAFRVTDALSDDERATLMGGSLQQIYGWTPGE